MEAITQLSLPYKPDVEAQKCPLPTIPEFKESEIREALLEEVSTHCCYGKKAAKGMTIISVKHTIAFHYVLETFTEMRTTNWISEPYSIQNGFIDRQDDDNPPPDIWDVHAIPPTYFKNYVFQIELPHTAVVETCEECDGEGKYECPTCLGQGWEFCPYCHGNKYNPLYTDDFDGDCNKCDSGERTCWECNGDEEVCCKSCTGTGEIKSYLKLMVVWENQIDDHVVVEKTVDLTAGRIRGASGTVACEEEGPSLLPLTHFPIATVVKASEHLIELHKQKFDSFKVLKQRHRVYMIPVAAVRYKWKEHEGLFHVYGFEKWVHIPDYPEKCGCCSIL